MQVLNRLNDAEVGQVLSFIYLRGSRQGQRRTVEVQEVLSDRIVGHDLHVDEPRQYLFDQAVEIQVLNKPVVNQEAVNSAMRACGIDPLQETTRVRRQPMSFVEARQRIHDQIDELSGEDLAEVLAEIDGHDRAEFNADDGVVIVEDDVCVPHCCINMDCDPSAAGIDWVNEDGETVTSITRNNKGIIELSLDGERVAAEQFIIQIGQHFGLTIK